ncbi:hypothetical protein BD410DRAFT_642824 [Rickenella mellea]|uniref:Uncharacterized protein n=1 Tax=Rickenella mellea TaxID=50990 RepID=A0A4Y7PNV6_9AGAM|nr:hypothetical protein BD410DRAFT_642824 [Rickenella mellea]
MATLNNVKEHLAKKIQNLQKRSAPLVLEDGIKRIPDEILAQIFEAGHQISEHVKFSLHVSHVSRRFRQVSLRTPLLWTRIASSHHNDLIEAFILRSGQLDLQVALSNHPIDKLRSSLRKIRPHSGRWSRLSLHILREILEIMDEIGLTYFPRLRYIYHELDVKPKGSKWHMPLLAHFDGWCSPFPRGVSFPFMSQLTRLELVFEDYPSFDLASLTQALYRMLNLRDLDLEFRDCDAVATDSDFVALPPMETPKPHSFHIESLKITLKDSVPYTFATSLYSALQYLTASLVDVSLLMYGDPHDYLKDSPFPYGSTMRLQIGLPCHLPFLLRRLLQNCKILHTVEFEMSAFALESNAWPEWPQLPSLRHLRFHGYALLEERRVETMARGLFTREDFESLEIISCHQISEKFLLNLQDEVGERLKWSC